MRDELKLLLENKDASKYSAKQKESIKKYVNEFAQKVHEVSMEMGLAYKAELNITKEGIVPTLSVMPFDPKEVQPKEESND